jgi:hypothetical protein
MHPEERPRAISWGCWALAIWLGACATPGRPRAPAPPVPPAGGAVGAQVDAAPGRVWPIALAGADGLAGFAPRAEGRFGLDRIHVDGDGDGDGAPPGSPAPFLRVDYPKGSASPAVAGGPGGGAQFLGTQPGTPADHLFLRYRLRFAEGFDFGKGGKLPGLYGGRKISGGHIPDGSDGFSTRFMWRAGGAGEVYAYLPSSVTWGTSLGRGSFRFQPGRWHCLEQEVSLNTPGRPDGFVHVWLDGRPVFAQEGLVFRTVATLRIEGVFFSTFFGGNDASWSSSADTHADFADFAVGQHRVGCPDSTRPTDLG